MEIAATGNVVFVQKLRLKQDMRISICPGLSTRDDGRPKTVPILNEPSLFTTTTPVKRSC